MPDDFDARFRAAALAYVDAITARSGGLVLRDELTSFHFEGGRVALVAPRSGIWKPRILSAALSILTTFTPEGAEAPYDDHLGQDGFPRYKWRGSNPNHSDNVALRRAAEAALPLIWLRGVAPGIYQPARVWLAGEEPEQTQFVVALSDELRDFWEPNLAFTMPQNPVRRYAERLVRERLHQPVFRAQVLVAYGRQCALCRLRHGRLLDAAHIKEDSDGGEPVVPNGIAMCAIHHRAFDAEVLGIRPDYRVEIRSDVLHEHDGPTLQHALQGLHGAEIDIPHRRVLHPDRDLLEERYERFRLAG